MKFIFNICIAALALFPVTETRARDIVLVESLAGPEQGKMLKSILEKKFGFPEKLITLRIIRTACTPKSEAIVHLCLLPDGDLKILKLNEYVVKNSFGQFMNQDTNQVMNQELPGDKQ